MLKTYLYIPEHLNKKIDYTAKAQNRSKAEVIRQTLDVGFDALEKQKSGGAEVLLKLAEFAKKQKIKGPKDGSTNHDYYLWGLPKKNPNLKP